MFIWKLSRKLKALKPDIVHTRNWSGMDGIIAAKLAGITNILHGEHGWDMSDPYGTNHKRILIRRMASLWVKEYTCVSKQMKVWLKKTVKVDKPVSQIYNGVSFSLSSNVQGSMDKKKELGISENTFVVGVVGRLDLIKDHPTLFQAIEKVRERVPHVLLLVIGDGQEREKLAAIAKEGILFLGNRSDVPDLMQVMDLFVLSSKNEGISNTVLEAMVAGLPIVVTHVGGNPELIDHGKNGTIVSSGNAQEMASAILQYCENKQLGRLHGAAARKKAMECFGLQEMSDIYHIIYHKWS